MLIHSVRHQGELQKSEQAHVLWTIILCFKWIINEYILINVKWIDSSEILWKYRCFYLQPPHVWHQKHALNWYKMCFTTHHTVIPLTKLSILNRWQNYELSGLQTFNLNKYSWVDNFRCKQGTSACMPVQINSQSLEDTQVGYISQKYTLDKYTLEKKTLEKYT